MRRLAVVFVALALTEAAAAAPPAVTVSASPTSGVAPLRVTLTAAGDPASYVWQLGEVRAQRAPPSRTSTDPAAGSRP